MIKIILFLIVSSVACVKSLDALSNIFSLLLRALSPTDSKFIAQTKCIKGVGCFDNGPPWYEPLLRPYSALPEDMDDIQYFLFTPQHPNDSWNIRMNSIEDSPFNSTLPTKILIHGFNANEESLLYSLYQKDVLLRVGNYNVIVVDYRKYSLSPYYQAAANIRVVGARTALLLKTIMESAGVAAESMHCIGPSLGAHACGYIGKRIPNFGRISGLSPAGPYFSGTPSIVHLDPSDALFVDAINTAAGGLGTFQHFGQQNFFPDGGIREPGCKKNPPLDELIERLQTNRCDHARATFQYTESIHNCTFRAVNCSSREDFVDHKCPPETSTVAVMGFHAKPIPGIGPKDSLFLRTGATEPYCVRNSVMPHNKSDAVVLKNVQFSLQNLLIGKIVLLLDLF